MFILHNSFQLVTSVERKSNKKSTLKIFTNATNPSRSIYELSTHKSLAHHFNRKKMKYLCEFSAANGFFVIIISLSFLVLLASFLIGFVAHAQYQPFSLAYQPQKTYYRAADPSTSTPNETVTSATSTAASTPIDQQPPPTPLPTTQPNQPSASNDDLKSSKLQSMVQQLYTAQGQVSRPTFQFHFNKFLTRRRFN